MFSVSICIYAILTDVLDNISNYVSWNYLGDDVITSDLFTLYIFMKHKVGTNEDNIRIVDDELRLEPSPGGMNRPVYKVKVKFKNAPTSYIL